MAVTAMAVYTDPQRPFLTVLIVGVAFALTNFPERLGVGRVRRRAARLPR